MKVAWCVLLFGLVSCASSDQVTRRRGDVEVQGRKISPIAYAWYARGVHHERAGDLTRAERDYRAALEHDRQSGAAWAALGRVVCRRNSSEALQTLAKGLRKSERTGVILLERGRCKLRALTARSDLPPSATRKIRDACRDGLEAMELEPKNRQVSAFVEECYRAADDPETAKRYERGARLYLGQARDNDGSQNLRAVDHAIWTGNLPLARQLGLTLITPGELALRALAWGKSDLARQQARLVIEAAPNDANALIVLTCLGEYGSSVQEDLQDPSALGVVLLSAHLARTVGPEAAHQLTTNYQSLIDKSGDPLVRRLVEGESFPAKP